MYKDFAEYWADKEEMFKKLGVDRATARTIWGDAVDCCIDTAIKEIKSGKK